MANWRYMAIIFLLSVAAAPVSGTAIEAASGKLDLSHWSFTQHPKLALRGEWAFYWQDFIAPAPTQHKTQHQEQQHIYVPGTWNHYVWEGKELPGNGYASYRLVVELPAEREQLALYVKSLYRAADIWVNGERLLRVGRPAREPAGEIPREAFYVVALPDAANRLDIVVHISSFHHIDGGLNRAFELGTYDTIVRHERNRQLLAHAVFGAALVLACIFLTISLTFNRSADRVYAYGAGLSFSYSLRVMGTEKIWFIFNPAIHADWALRFEYYGMILTQVFYVYVIRGLYPTCTSAPVCRLLAALGAASVAFITVTPAAVFAYVRNPWAMSFFLVIGYACWVTLKANKRRLPGALPMAIIAFASLPIMANDVLAFFNVYQGVLYNELAYFLVMSGIVAVLMGRLSGSANEADRLAAALRKANVRLRQRVDARTRELADKVDELDQLNRQAQLDREVAVAANRKKTEFLGIMSHEVRTPLSAIQGGLQLLEQEPLSDNGRLLLDNAIASGASLLEIVNNTLDIARIETSDHHLRGRDFCLYDWIDQLAGLARIPIEAKGLAFITEFSGRLCVEKDTLVHGDSHSLRQILINLLNNATKFTQHGSITLRITQTETTQGTATLLFEVVDSGIGISSVQQDRIFERFFQSDTSFTREHSGTGLGLSISQRLAEAMGGEIKVDSQPGQGSRFYLTIELPIVVKPHALPETELPATPAAVAEQLHILIAEDDKANRDILRILLERAGHSVTETATGCEAVAVCRHQRFDLILLDIRLPGIDGVAACRAIRSLNDHHVNTPIVAVTANINKTDIQAYLSSGLDGVLPKPVSASALGALLRNNRPGGEGPAPRQLEFATTGAEILDEQNLATLLQAIGPESLAEQLLNLQQSLEQLVDALTAACRAHDLRQTREIAHKLKGNAAYQGKNALALLCDQVEHYPDTATAAEWHQLIEQIRQASTLAQDHLSRWMTTHLSSTYAEPQPP
ncbi:response regulator [Exilibacterium tricleocarpae]|uniref:histidine kinase n=1 Tax=Exilibacterium tricleocarpae TaxID=2591008 RepID=A0A545ST74_9GAMM|nr:ATP-binding protein [Exilibacterium tricleocarpae]TQV68135.1 response regulator [Exilibacterium tricleocarpae]